MRKYDRPQLGARFGAWELVGYAVSRRETVGRMRCQCGAEQLVAFSTLRRGDSTQCRKCANARSSELLRARMGNAAVISDAALRERWLNRRLAAISRCHDPANAKFKDYGGRGIEFHAAWRESSVAFLEYIVTLPGWRTQSLEMDRRDNNGNYEPGNIRLATRSEQCSNTRTCHRVAWAGGIWTAQQFYERFAPRYRSSSTVSRKLREGVSPERIVADQDGCRGAYVRHPERGPAAPLHDMD